MFNLAKLISIIVRHQCRNENQYCFHKLCIIEERIIMELEQNLVGHHIALNNLQ